MRTQSEPDLIYTLNGNVLATEVCHHRLGLSLAGILPYRRTPVPFAVKLLSQYA